jgi:hypothetical protein
MTEKELRDAIMIVASASPPGIAWTGDDFSQEQPEYESSPVDNAIAVILNAVISGQLVVAARQ